MSSIHSLVGGRVRPGVVVYQRQPVSLQVILNGAQTLRHVDLDLTEPFYETATPFFQRGVCVFG